MIRAEPLLLKPGSFMPSAPDWVPVPMPPDFALEASGFQAAVYATLATVLFRVLAIIFN